MSPAHEASLSLLLKAARKFRYYEQNHRAKVGPWRAELTTRDMPWGQRERIEQAIKDTLAKAEANAELASEIERHLQLFPEANLAD